MACYAIEYDQDSTEGVYFKFPGVIDRWDWVRGARERRREELPSNDRELKRVTRRLDGAWVVEGSHEKWVVGKDPWEAFREGFSQTGEFKI